MGTIGSSFYQCSSDCLHVKCCGITRRNDGKVHHAEAYVCDNFYSNTSTDDPDPFPEAHSANVVASLTNGPRCNKTNDLSTNRNRDCAKCCSCSAHRKCGESLIQSPCLTCPFQVSYFHDNRYRNQLGDVRRNKNVPFPSVEALSAGLNNNMSFSPAPKNLVYLNSRGTENPQACVKPENNDRAKIPNNFYESRAAVFPFSNIQHESSCSSGESTEFYNFVS